MPKRFEPKLPSLAPERDQIDAFRKTQGTGNRTRTATSPSDNKRTQKPKLEKSSSGFTSFVVLLLLVAVGGGGWWLFDQNKKMNIALTSAEKRIHNLEQQLSVTGEEMGESTVAMQARLALLGQKTEELWTQMDKLWASAWRKNQADIIKLSTQVSSQSKAVSNQSSETNKLRASFKAVTQKLDEGEINIGILSEQVAEAQTLKNQLEQVRNDMATIKSKSFSGDQQQIELASSVTQNNETLKALLGRLKSLETKVSSGETVIKEFDGS